jgi:hypothetical protein
MRPVYPQAAKNDGKLWLEYGVTLVFGQAGKPLFMRN